MKMDVSLPSRYAIERGNSAVKELADKLAARIAASAPVLTGALAESIKAVTVGDSWAITGLNYAKFVEYGTSDTPAIPFIRKSVEVETPNIDETVRKNFS